MHDAGLDSFVGIVGKCVDIREVRSTIVNELANKNVAYTPKKSSGRRRYKIELVWDFIGEVNLLGDD